MSGRISLPDACAVGQHEPAIMHRTGGSSAKVQNACGKCGRQIFRKTATGGSDDPWLTEEQRAAIPFDRGRTSPLRVYGTVLCQGCGCPVDVVYPHTNSDDTIGLIDHFDAPNHRCPHAGLTIWTKGLGWHEDRFRQRYGEAAITKAVFPTPPLYACNNVVCQLAGQHTPQCVSEYAKETSAPAPAIEEPPPADRLLPCQQCGGREFKVDALYVATDTIEVREDGAGFDVLDTSYGDGEWEDDGNVRCVGCGHSMKYKDWSNRERDEDDEQQTTNAPAGAAGDHQK